MILSAYSFAFPSVCVYTLIHMCMHVTGQQASLSGIPSTSFDTGSLLGLQLTKSVKLADQ